MPLFTKLPKKQTTASMDVRRAAKQKTISTESSANETKNANNEFSSTPAELDELATTSINDNITTSKPEPRFSNGHLRKSNRKSNNESSPRTSFRSPTPPPPPDSVKTIKGGNPMSYAPLPQDTKLVFHCQLAHGSPMGLLSGFTNLRELYERAAECYEIPVDDILYCTLNTDKANMDRLLGGQIGLNDFIFIHIKGQKKEVEVVKDEPSLGLTITDNGAAKAFIKRIKTDSVFGRLADAVQAGDHIETINGESMISKKHFDVAKYLRELPIGATFTLRLVEPLKPARAYSSPRTSMMSSSMSMLAHPNANGMRTLRFKAKGKKAAAIVESSPSEIVLDRINAVLESYLGIHDSELALTIWDMAKEPANVNNPVAFLSAVKRSELSEFQIPDDVIFDLWAATRDGLILPTTKCVQPVSDGVTYADEEKTLTRPHSKAEPFDN